MFSLTHHVQNRTTGLIGQIKYQLFQRHFIHTIRYGLIVSTIFLTVFTAFLLSERQMLGLAVVGGIAAVVVLIFIYNHLELGVFLLMFTTTVFAPIIPRDITTTLLLLIVLTLVWLLKLLLVERSFASLRASPPNKFVMLWCVAAIIAFVWSSSYVDPAVSHFQNGKFLPRVVTLLVMILSPVGMLLFGNFLYTIKDIKRVIWFYLGYGTFILIPRLADFRLPTNFNTGGQLPVWVAIFALGQLLYNSKLLRWQKVALTLIIAAWIYVQFGLGRTWLSGWVPLFAGLGVIIFLRSRLVFILILVLCVIGAIVNSEMFSETLESENQESGETRVEAGSLALNFGNEHFLFGTGPAGYYFYAMVYIGDTHLSHNNYIDIYAQTGVAGITAWILLWGSIGWMLWRTYQLTPKTGFEGGLVVSMVAIYIVTLIIMMLGDWVIPFTYTQSMRGLSYTIWPWLWCGIGIALYHHATLRKAAPTALISSGDDYAG